MSVNKQLRTANHIIMFYVILIFIIAIILLIIAYLWKSNQYLQTRGVKCDKPVLLFGNMYDNIMQKVCFTDLIEQLYKKFQNERYFGLYQFLSPTIFISDLELIKKIGIKDFDHFTDHQAFSEEVAEVDPLWSNNLFAVTGDKWRDMRTTLSPSFTGSKMKIMFDLINQCTLKFVEYYVEKNEDVITVEMKDIFTRYSNNVIATCAFGIECDSLREQNNEFYKRGNDITDFSGWTILKFMGYRICPALMKIFKIRLITQDNAVFFNKLINDTMKLRQEQGIVRQDMIHLLMEAKKDRENDQDKKKMIITNEDIAAQALSFFFAGFDTTSTLLCYVAYELAVNKDIQDKLKEEIEQTLDAYNGTLTYDAVMKMKYLDMIISETLRLWPPSPITDRLCVKNYVIPAEIDGEQDLVIEKGTSVWFPIYSIQRDERYFSDPDKFIPERFNEENKGSINQQAYIPFGLGPRICIGLRFAIMETKALLIHLVNTFEIVPVKESVIPVVLSKKHFNMNAEGGMWFGLKKRV